MRISFLGLLCVISVIYICVAVINSDQGYRNSNKMDGPTENFLPNLNGHTKYHKKIKVHNPNRFPNVFKIKKVLLKLLGQANSRPAMFNFDNLMHLLDGELGFEDHKEHQNILNYTKLPNLDFESDNKKLIWTDSLAATYGFRSFIHRPVNWVETEADDVQSSEREDTTQNLLLAMAEVNLLQS